MLALLPETILGFVGLALSLIAAVYLVIWVALIERRVSRLESISHPQIAGGSETMPKARR
jgi:HAMP domain-containing protein